MKLTKKCPKCSSNEIFYVPAVIGNGYGSGNVIPTGLIGTIKVNRCICGICGYAEEWVDYSDLRKLKNKFKRL